MNFPKGAFIRNVLSKFDLTNPNRTTRSVVFLVVGLIATGWLLNIPAGLLGKADAVGYAVCHRIDLRSFHLGDRALPLCARCSGMYLGAMLGLLYQAVRGGRRAGMPAKSVLVVFGLFVVAFGLDGVNSYFHLFPGFVGIYEPQNWLRLLTGSGMGLAMAGMLMPAFHQTMWRKWSPDSNFNSLKSFLPVVLLTLALDALVMSENPLILYPLALISALGVLFLLTLVYAMLWLVVLRQENRFEHFSQLVVTLVAGFGIALLQIAALDFVRFLFTGTWDGFHLG